MQPLIFYARVFGFAVLSTLVGCQGEGYGLNGAVKVTGEVTADGTPLRVEGLENATGMIVIGFCPVDGDGKGQQRIESTAASIGADGTFEVVDGITPGTYVITIRQWEPYPQNDKLKGKFSEKNSKIIREIRDDTELIIDVTNLEG